MSRIAFSGDGATVAVTVSKLDEAGYDSEIVLWDVAKGTERSRIKGIGYCSHIGVAFDGKYLAIMTDKTLGAHSFELKVIEPATGKTTSSARFKRGQTPQCQAVSRDGKTVAIGLSDGTVQLDRVPVTELATRYTALNFLFPIPKDPQFKNDLVAVTRKAAQKVATAFNSMVQRDQKPIERDRAQRFILQCVVALFAEDIGLLPRGFFTEVLDDCKKPGGSSFDLLGGLFWAIH